MISEVIKKEMREMTRDKGFMLILFVLPVVLMFVSSATFKGEVNHLSTVLVPLDGGNYQAKVVNAITESEYFTITSETSDIGEAMGLLETGVARAVIVIPQGFSKSIEEQATGQVRIFIDSSDFLVLRTLKVAASKIALDSGKNISFGIIDDIEESKSLVNRTKEKIDYATDKIDEMNQTVEDHFVTMDKIIVRVDQWRNWKKINDTINDIRNIKQNISTMGLSRSGTGIDQVSNLTDDVDEKLKKLNPAYLSEPVNVDKVFQYGDVTYLDYLAPAVMSMGVFFVGMFMTTINIVEEKVRKTMQRLYLTPIKPLEIILGKFVAFSLLGFVESFYILMISIFVFNITVNGDIFTSLLVTIVLTIPSVAMGLLFSIIVKTQKEAMVLLPLIVIPAILLSRTFSPVETMPDYMQAISLLSPMTYSNAALREVMIRGHGIGFILPELAAMLAFGVILLATSTVMLKKRLE